MLGDMWEVFSSWHWLSQVAVGLVLFGPIFPYVAYRLDQAIDRLKQQRIAARRRHAAWLEDREHIYQEAKTAVERVEQTEPLNDWCPTCDKIYVRKLMAWDDEGAWRCRWCISGDTPPENLGSLTQLAILANTEVSPVTDRPPTNIVSALTGQPIFAAAPRWQPHGTGEVIRDGWHFGWAGKR